MISLYCYDECCKEIVWNSRKSTNCIINLTVYLNLKVANKEMPHRVWYVNDEKHVYLAQKISEQCKETIILNTPDTCLMTNIQLVIESALVIEIALNRFSNYVSVKKIGLYYALFFNEDS